MAATTAAASGAQTLFERWIARRHPPQRRSVRLQRRDIYILPTAAGWLYAAALLLMLLWAINYNNGMAYMLTFLLAAVVLTTMWRTHNTLLDLELSPLPVDPVFAGGEASFRYLLSHNSPSPRHGVGLHWPGHAPAYAAVVDSAGSELALSLPAAHRGRHDAPRLRVVSRFPLGLFQAWSWVHFDHQCLAYPRPAGDLPLPEGTTEQAGRARPITASGDGGDDFAGLRDYRPGDPQRRIAWRASARSEQLQVKQFQRESSGERLLDWTALAPADAETRLSQLCRWVLRAERERLRYALRLPNYTLTPALGGAHRERCLRALALYPETTDA